ncbi:SPOR domain-containing protein [Maribellus sp. YY47]|uniref:SPOR domain-containing protein n=1 Tax=Maribellus sp. YY47 TaxID=2929486 RepID=UPI0020012158|nr:SPOR domain-containing protein [Maribellus sp. YY47]MCK3685531.1 SPOR domain-containing protein [Maribellus sp. YY47]
MAATFRLKSDMLRYLLILAILIPISTLQVLGQSDSLSIHFVKNELVVRPGEVVNLAYQIENLSADVAELELSFSFPDSWNLITKITEFMVEPGQKKLGIVSLKVEGQTGVGKYPVSIQLKNRQGKQLLAEASMNISVLEIENITLELIEKPTYVSAGDEISASYRIQNLGNTSKNVFINTNNCDVKGTSTLSLEPGASASVQVVKSTSEEAVQSVDESFTVRAQVDERVLKSVYASTVVLPSKKASKDLYFRFPVKASATYLSTNRDNDYQSVLQYQVEGSGSLDTEGKHQLGFMARWPDNSDLSFLGLYDQYYLTYSNDNLEVFLGDKSYSLTPLTESFRYGRGVESKLTLNNGWGVGMKYLQPRFYQEIESELAAFTDFSFKRNNKIGLYYLSKKYQLENDPAQLFSFTSLLNPFKRTSVEIELSHGQFLSKKSNAIRAGLNSQFSIFQFNGVYYDTGKDYPGYYTNSRFYSAGLSVRVSKRISLYANAREDFRNAQLDTFFVTAPYSRSLQGAVSYKTSERSNLKVYWRQYEREDRLIKEKFHYQTDSWNLQFSHRFRKLYYYLNGEIGETTNFLENAGQENQSSYRAAADITYRFNSQHSVRVFGNWSNINRIISDDQRSLLVGMAATSRISKNLRANFYLQNAYDIDDYYRNRNLMQFNLNYSFLRKHEIALRSFYTIFRHQVDDPEFTVSATYSYKLGIPLKQVVKAGKVLGRISNQKGDAVEGVYLRMLNETTVTNKNGEFEFKLVPPGKQLLIVDRARLDVDEIPSIPMPLELEVLDNDESVVNIQIQKGARLNGQLLLGQNKLAALDDKSVKPANIVVELRTDFETFRIATDSDGRFSFPLVRPGEVELRIYGNTVPAGYKPKQSTYTYHLEPGDQKYAEIVLESSKKEIIFKSSGNALSVEKGSMPVVISKRTVKEPSEPDLFYSVQIGAFRKALRKDSKFLKGQSFYFEKQIDSLHKYFIGSFKTLKEAREELEKLKTEYESPFVVIIKNGKVINLIDFRENGKD